MSSLTVNIALFPSEVVKTRAIALSETLQPFGTVYTLQEETYYPHITLYRLQVKTEAIEKISELLSDIAKRSQAISLSANGYKQTDRFLGVEFVRTQEIEDLQMAVVKAINPLRDGLREMDKIRLQTATGEMRESLEKYGYQSIGEPYRPSISITRFSQDYTVDVRSLPPPQDFSGQFAAIGLSEQGKDGASIRKIAEFNLLV